MPLRTEEIRKIDVQTKKSVEYPEDNTLIIVIDANSRPANWLSCSMNIELPVALLDKLIEKLNQTKISLSEKSKT
jgi:hypothetical protein